MRTLLAMQRFIQRAFDGPSMGDASMPAKSKKQQQLMGADLARKRAGKKTRTGMSLKQLEEFASISRKKLPAKAKKKGKR